MNKLKKIGVFTSIRSEYGLLTPLIAKLNNNKGFDLRLIVGGAHLVDSYGKTINQIREDGFPISALVPFISEVKQENTYAQMLSRLQLKFGEYIQSNPLHLMIILGDRFELIPVVLACLLNNVPIAHISGGEFTEGAIDNQIRHAITKMAHLHFPATTAYGETIKKMGEEEWRICVSGEPGLDLVMQLELIPKAQLFDALGLDMTRKTICCTFHPETISKIITADFVGQTLLRIIERTPYQVLVTSSNFDLGGAEINEMLARVSAAHRRIIYHQSLGQIKYYSLLKHVDLVMGNSSSGLVEAQTFGVPVINVGDRQKGRLANANVYNCAASVEKIMNAIAIVTGSDFKKSYFGLPNIYGDGTACDKIISFIGNINWNNLLEKKNTYQRN